MKSAKENLIRARQNKFRIIVYHSLFSIRSHLELCTLNKSMLQPFLQQKYHKGFCCHVNAAWFKLTGDLFVDFCSTLNLTAHSRERWSWEINKCTILQRILSVRWSDSFYNPFAQNNSNSFTDKKINFKYVHIRSRMDVQNKLMEWMAET